MDPLEHDRRGRPWLFANEQDAPTDEVANALKFDGAITELTAVGWDRKDHLFSEVAADFPLPDYFGHNWDALNECLFTESFEGRLVVVRNVTPAALDNFARFVDLFSFVWWPEPEARALWPSLFDDRWTPSRVAIVALGFGWSGADAHWPNRGTRRYTFQSLELEAQDRNDMGPLGRRGM